MSSRKLKSAEDSVKNLDDEEDYADFNREYFTSLYEQEKMLSDAARMNFYHAMIESRISKGQRVLDLGTGTGILAAWAGRRGALVTAIDHSETMIDFAKKLLLTNGIRNTKFVNCHCSEFSVKKSERFDVIIHEQMGDILFDEDMVANVCDARNRLLKPGGVILPNDFQLFCDPVKLNDKRNVTNIWNNKIHGIDFSPFISEKPDPNIDPGYYHFRSSDPSLVDYHLSDSYPIVEFKLETVQEDSLSKSVKFSRQIGKAGRMDGFAVYFKVILDKQTSLSTGPKADNRASHWGYRILRSNASTVVMCNEGDTMHVSLDVEEWEDLDSWRWSFYMENATHHSGSRNDATDRATTDIKGKSGNNDASSGSLVDSKSKKRRSFPHNVNIDSETIHASIGIPKTGSSDGGGSDKISKSETVEFLTMEELARLRSTTQRKTVAPSTTKKLKTDKYGKC